MFAGRDVTYALATGCKACAADTTKTAQDLQQESSLSSSSSSSKQLDEAKQWLSFFQLHDKYSYVGKLDKNPMEAKMNEWIDDAIRNKNENEMMTEAMMPPLPGMN